MGEVVSAGWLDEEVWLPVFEVVFWNRWNVSEAHAAERAGRIAHTPPLVFLAGPDMVVVEEWRGFI